MEIRGGLAGALIALIAAVILIAAAGKIGGRARDLPRPDRHAAVPVVLVPAAVLPLVAASVTWGVADVRLVTLAPARRSAGSR